MIASKKNFGSAFAKHVSSKLWISWLKLLSAPRTVVIVTPHATVNECTATAHAGLHVLGGRTASPAAGQSVPSDPQQILNRRRRVRKRL